MGKLDKIVLELLEETSEPLTLASIASKLEKPEKTVYRTLKRLFEKGKIHSQGRRYKIAEQ